MLKYIIIDSKFIVSAIQMKFCDELGDMESKL